MSQSISPDRDGLQVREEEFTLPQDSINLDRKTKRAVTICNLFINHHYGISDIVRLLDEDRRNVIQVLVQKGIVNGRRVRQTRPPDGMEHRKAVFARAGT